MASVFDPEMHSKAPMTPYSAKRELIEKGGGLPPVPPKKPIKPRFATSEELKAHIAKINDRTKRAAKKKRKQAKKGIGGLKLMSAYSRSSTRQKPCW